LSERALYWSRHKTLVVADLHLGKAATFRAAAIPVPGGTTAETLSRPSQAIDHSKAERLVILGDLIHAYKGRAAHTIAAVTAWRHDYTNIDVLLVRGNHDLHAGNPPTDWQMTCLDGPVPDPPFIYRHEPQPAADGYVLAGHLHPSVVLSGRGRQSLKLPCFHFMQTVGTLPAFGDFTGSAVVRPGGGDRVFVLVGNEVVDVSPTA
jgi:DNA ligase-associated metallophosphoesterase